MILRLDSKNNNRVSSWRTNIIKKKRGNVAHFMPAIIK